MHHIVVPSILLPRIPLNLWNQIQCHVGQRRLSFASVLLRPCALRLIWLYDGMGIVRPKIRVSEHRNPARARKGKWYTVRTINAHRIASSDISAAVLFLLYD